MLRLLLQKQNHILKLFPYFLYFNVSYFYCSDTSADAGAGSGRVSSTTTGSYLIFFFLQPKVNTKPACTFTADVL